MNFLLKIVEGPNRGAEIALVEGVAVTLGKGEDCDIVLADATLPDEPMKIEASESGVSVDGEPIEPLRVRTAGATSFAVGPADSPWGELAWPKAESAATGNGEAGERHETKDEKESSPEPRAPSPAPQDKPSDEPPKKGRRGCLGCLVALIVLLMVLVLLGWLYCPGVRDADFGKTAEFLSSLVSRSADRDAPPSAAVPKAPDLHAVAAKYGLSLVESNGVARMSGNLGTRRERLAATAEAYEASPGAELDLTDDESFRTAAEDALFTLTEGALKVVSATNRVLEIAGASLSPSALEKTLRSLNADMPKLANVDVRRVSIGARAVREATGRDAAADDGPAKRPLSQRAARLAAKKAEAPSFPVCGILTVPYPCLVMRDGKRVFEGASIGDSVILKIDADSVTVTNSAGRFVWRP